MAYTFIAGADLTGKQGFTVKVSADDKKVVLATANSVNTGILVDTNTSGKAVVVAQDGERVLAKLGGAVSFGDKLKSDSEGKLVLADTHNDKVIAEAQQDGADEDLIYVVVAKYNLVNIT